MGCTWNFCLKTYKQRVESFFSPITYFVSCRYRLFSSYSGIHIFESSGSWISLLCIRVLPWLSCPGCQGRRVEERTTQETWERRLSSVPTGRCLELILLILHNHKEARKCCLSLSLVTSLFCQADFFFSVLFPLQETSWDHHKKGCSETHGPDGKPGPWIHHV